MHRLSYTVYPCDPLQSNAVIFGHTAASQVKTLLNCVLENIRFGNLDIRRMGTWRIGLVRLRLRWGHVFYKKNPDMGKEWNKF